MTDKLMTPQEGPSSSEILKVRLWDIITDACNHDESPCSECSRLHFKILATAEYHTSQAIAPLRDELKESDEHIAHFEAERDRLKAELAEAQERVKESR